MLILALVTVIALLTVSEALAGVRVAVLPFRNMNGSFDYAERCYDLADSLYRSLDALQGDESFDLVPADSVEDVLAGLNLDPSNPQYVSDMWKAVELLQVDKVITGGFNVKYKKIFVNAYIYDVETKLAEPKFQAKNIFKKYDKALEAVPLIVKKLTPFFDS